jgi:nitrate/nitrite-specific signal transduction histidine kinase
LHRKDYQAVIDSLSFLGKSWKNDTHKVMLENVDITIRDTLFPLHQQIMEKLNTFISYEDPFIVFEVTPMVEDKGEVMEATRKALDRINTLLVEQEMLISEMRDRSDNSFAQLKSFIFVMLAVLVLLAIIITAYTALSLSTPINRTKNMLLSMSKGILPETKLKEGSDEIGQMAKALHLVVRSLRDVSNFAIQIGKGNFDTEFTPLSDEDVLGHSLIEMRGELKQAKNEEEIRAEENRQRTWSSQGVALFSDILRQNDDDVNELTFEIISNMVQYTSSNQGGIFIVNDNDRDNLFLEMTACYAYDRQKFLKKKIEIGEGLVGRCYQEQEKESE